MAGSRKHHCVAETSALTVLQTAWDIWMQDSFNSGYSDRQLINCSEARLSDYMDAATADTPIWCEGYIPDTKICCEFIITSHAITVITEDMHTYVELMSILQEAYPTLHQFMHLD